MLPFNEDAVLFKPLRFNLLNVREVHARVGDALIGGFCGFHLEHVIMSVSGRVHDDHGHPDLLPGDDGYIARDHVDNKW